MIALRTAEEIEKDKKKDAGEKRIKAKPIHTRRTLDMLLVPSFKEVICKSE